MSLQFTVETPTITLIIHDPVAKWEVLNREWCNAPFYESVDEDLEELCGNRFLSDFSERMYECSGVQNTEDDGNDTVTVEIDDPDELDNIKERAEELATDFTELTRVSSFELVDNHGCELNSLDDDGDVIATVSFYVDDENEDEDEDDEQEAQSSENDFVDLVDLSPKTKPQTKQPRIGPHKQDAIDALQWLHEKTGLPVVNKL